MRVKDVIATLEVFAPLPLQDGYDNAGLQVGLTEAEISGALLCLDVTEQVLAEAVGKGYNLVVAHHPLLFRPLRRLSDETQVERCVRYAVSNNLNIYAAHTNLDNAAGGVSCDLAARLGLQEIEFLNANNAESGSGAIGVLPQPMAAREFVAKVKDLLGTECVMGNALLERPISRVALCGGAGDFLLGKAIDKGADAFLTGEMHYHQYFGHEQELQIIVAGHYQTERYVPELLRKIINDAHPELPTCITTVDTNPIVWL